jgi:hypothetical protein
MSAVLEPVPATGRLVLIGRAAPDPVSPRPDPLLAGCLRAARTVLEVGPASASLARTARRPDVETWRSVEASEVGRVEGRFDMIVLTATLHDMPDPIALIRALTVHADQRTVLVLACRNGASWSALDGLVEGEPAASSGLTPAALTRLLLDEGWLPEVSVIEPTLEPEPGLERAAQALAPAARVPEATVRRLLSTSRFAVNAIRTDPAPPPAGERARFTVVVPTTRDGQFRRNVESSPGLREVDAHVVSYRGAANAAEALYGSRGHCESDWIVLCHQDVYFPAGFGRRLNALLGLIGDDDRRTTLIGFAGMGVDPVTHATAPAGLVIDRMARFDHPASDSVVSIDEFAVVMARDSVHRIDPSLGWHLWATDLCIVSICRHRRFPRIVRIPAFHNSTNDYVLPESFHRSAKALAAKHAGFGMIRTLCGDIDATTPQ